MKNIVLLFLFFVPAFLFAQYPTGTNKSRLGYQTTGDGLIWRGVAADTAIKPRTTANAYFQLDTVNRVLRRYIATQGSWQVVGATPDLSAYLLKSDTAAMLVKYIERGDTATMLAKYIERGDTAAMLANYPTFGDIATSLGNYLPILGGTLTGTGGAGFIGFPSQVSAPGTPASGLNVYAQGSSFNWKGTDGYERQFASTLTGGRTYTLPNVSGTFALGTGTADRLARWTATNTLAAGNLSDNGTKLQALLPWQFQSYTTAGRPTGVSGYVIDNSTNDWFERYSTVAGAWISPLQSSLTGGKGTAGRVLYTDANGRATDNANLLFTGTRFQTAGSIRFGRSSHTDTASIEKVSDVNSKIVRINNPGDVGGWNSGFVFRGGANGILASVGTFRIYTSSATLPGSTYFGNITESNAQTANGYTNVGVINKFTTTGAWDVGLNMNAGNSSVNPNAYSLTASKQFGVYIGGAQSQSVNNFSDAAYGIFIGYQYQPLTNGYGSSAVFSAKTDPGGQVEILRLQGKDGNICLGCTNAQYKIYTTSTDAYGLPRGTVAQRPTIITSTTPFRYNTDSTAMEYGESVGTWRLLATRSYARSLVAGLGSGTVTSVGLSLPSIFSVSGSPVTTSGTLSASFTGGTNSLFLRGDGRWMKSLYFNSSDSVQFNTTDPYFGSTALISLKGSNGSFDSRFNIADYGYINQALAIDTEDDARYNFDRSRGTVASPTALLKNDRIGGIYFRAHNGTSYRKAGYIGAVVDSIHAGANPQSKLIFGTSEVNSPETSSYWRFLIESLRNISVVNHVTGASMGVGFGSNITVLEVSTIDARFHVKGTGTTTDKTMLLEDSGGADILTVTDNKTIQAHGYGTGNKEAADLSKTQSNYIAGFATDGTVLDLEHKRDTTVYVVDTDLDWSAAITTAQISRRYNRVIFLMTTTAAAGSNSDLTLHTPDVNLMQVEYLIRSTDEAGGFTNTIQFGSNNAVASDNALAGSYTPSAGQGVGIRAGLRSGVYKYFYY